MTCARVYLFVFPLIQTAGQGGQRGVLLASDFLTTPTPASANTAPSPGGAGRTALGVAVYTRCFSRLILSAFLPTRALPQVAQEDLKPMHRMSGGMGKGLKQPETKQNAGVL
jgi:hypothetical protein